METVWGLVWRRVNGWNDMEKIMCVICVEVGVAILWWWWWLFIGGIFRCRKGTS